MRRIATCLLLVFAVAGCLYLVSDLSAATGERHCLLRMTSAEPGAEYAFEGAYIGPSGQGISSSGTGQSFMVEVGLTPDGGSVKVF